MWERSPSAVRRPERIEPLSSTATFTVGLPSRPGTAGAPSLRFLQGRDAMLLVGAVRLNEG